MIFCPRWEQRTGRGFMGTLGRSFLLGCRIHWVIVHTRHVLLMLTMLETLLLVVCKQVFIYVMNAPIIWFSNNHNTADSSMLGSELVAMRIARDLIVALRYKLRMFGVTLDGPSNVMCDNQGVVNNTNLPQYNFSNKQNAVNYHVVRKADTTGVPWVGKEDIETDLYDI